MKLRTPRGVKDFLPNDARWKYELEQKIHSVFACWSYQEVITPTFEFYDVLKQGDASADQTYRFFGHNGELLALRSDLTTPIARMVATRLKDQPKPLRLAYLANVFRHNDVQVGFQREFYQAGVELMGSGSPAADAEAIALAVTLFNELGVKDFKLDIGQIQYFRGIVEDCTCNFIKQRIWQLLLKKDFVGYETLIKQADIDYGTKELLLDLPNFQGKSEILDQAYQSTENLHARAAVKNLQEIYSLLQGYGIADQVNIDLSMVKSLEYYTGMVIEGYVPSLGFTLCSGGRYDNLSSQFGSQQPAVGFALGLERLMLVLEQQGLKPKVKQEGMLILPYSWSRAVKYAADQRAKGIRVEVDIQGLTRAQAEEYARDKHFAAVVIIEDSTMEMLEVQQD
ncbi:MAG: ATP phosphoribosyltransferase regulatory subunit [Firmicutes bacterium]|nr:ATP phosphoribosyltransferase regulatory subunit [Bacillota bacterium]